MAATAPVKRGVWRTVRRGAGIALAALLVGGALACAGLRAPGAGSGALRLVDVAGAGDPQRRASQRLVIEGLQADARADPERALSDYQRALQVDASNPYAYLALARHHLEAGDPRTALAHLERAEVLFESLGLLTPGVETHLIGLRGAALRAEGLREGDVLLAEAARRAPSVWGDGRLDASELE
jgi:tetratricopeptide (TPR) repeat protein